MGRRRSQMGRRSKGVSFFGYMAPEWMDNAIDAIKAGDEETFKAIKINNL